MLVALLQLDDPRLTFILGAVAQLFFVLIFYCIYREFKKTGDVKDEEMGGLTDNTIEDSDETVQQEQSDTIICCTGFSLYLCAYSIPSFIPLMTSVRGVQRVSQIVSLTHSLISHQGYKFSKRSVHADQRCVYRGDVLGRALTSFERLKRPTVRTMILLTVVRFAVYGMLLFAACAVDHSNARYSQVRSRIYLLSSFLCFTVVRGTL